MATVCYCGCGREIEGLRRRASNEFSKEILKHLTVMQGALERGDAGARTAETQTMADEGARHLSEIQRFLHGDVERDQLDRGRIKKWNKEGARLAETLLKSTTGPVWEPDDSRTRHLAHAGARARGVITDVRRKGWGNDQVSSLAMTVAVRTDDGTLLELERSLSIRSDKAPRVGETVEVAYDPVDLTQFVYRPVVEVPGVAPPPAAETSGDRIGRLRELADLYEQGLLTKDEFDAEKTRLLAE